MTEDEFLGKIEYEGGVFDALDYGLRSDALEDPESELGVEWDAIREAFDKFCELADQFADKWDI